MSDTLNDTPDLSRIHCPGCEPDRDPLREILRTEWCGTHLPARVGLDDALALEKMPSAYAQASLREGGIEGGAWCDAIHRPERAA